MKDYPNLSKHKTNRLIRRRPESEKKSSLKVLMAMIGLILVAFIFVQQRVEYIRTERQVRKLLREKREIESMILPLKLEERYLTHVGKIEKIASKKLGLQHPRKQQIIEIEVDRIGKEQQ